MNLDTTDCGARMPERRRVKAADIPDDAMLRAISAQCRKRDCWAIWWNIAAEDFPTFPEKVVHAKIRQLIKRRLVQGCSCGCRGDLELEPYGYSLIGEEPWREPYWRDPNYGPISLAREDVE